jgi:hypothetical protein
MSDFAVSLGRNPVLGNTGADDPVGRGQAGTE